SYLLETITINFLSISFAYPIFKSKKACIIFHFKDIKFVSRKYGKITFKLSIIVLPKISNDYPVLLPISFQIFKNNFLSNSSFCSSFVFLLFILCFMQISMTGNRTEFKFCRQSGIFFLKCRL